MTTVSAQSLWLQLIDAEYPLEPFVALEMLMESVPCERAEAIRLLHAKAGDWLNQFKPINPDYSYLCDLIRICELGTAEQHNSGMRLHDQQTEAAAGRPVRDQELWLEYYQRGDEVIAVLKKLISIP